jgi:uncharacterized protein (DUF2147 family)
MKHALPLLTALISAVLITGPAAAAPSRDDPPQVPAGIWLMQNGKAAVEFYRCGEELCGRLRWGRPDQFPDGSTKDRRNPDKAKQDRELCETPVIWGLEWRGRGEWGNGAVYDPTSGETYGAKIKIESPESLKVRGYVLGISLLGKSQVWRPAPPEILASLCKRPG